MRKKKRELFLYGFPEGTVFWGTGNTGTFAFESLKAIKKALKHPSLDENLVIFKLVRHKERVR